MQKAVAPLRGRVAVPGDKSVSHRVALLSLLADGACRGAGWLESEDTWRSAEAARALGADVELRDGVLTVTLPKAEEALARRIEVKN